MRSNFAILALLLAATMAVAQMRSPQAPSPAQNPYPNGQPQSPNNAPSGSSGNPQASSSTAGGHKLLQAKSQDELKAYQNATSKADPAQMEAAADAFAEKYPSSELKAALFVRAMNLYAQANNSEKLIELGRKAIAADPTNSVSLVQVGTALVEGTRDTDMDRDQRLAEAAKDAQGAIDNISQLMVPPDATPERIAAVKASIITMAYDTLGMVDLNKGDPAGAEQQFLKAVDASKAQPEAIIFLRLSVAQDKLKKYPEALDSASKALQYAPQGSAAQNLAKQQQERLQKLMAGGSTSSPATPLTAGSASSPAPVPGIAVVVVEPKTLSFISSLGPDVVFFTSREHPITRLADITADSEFGAWGPGPGASIQDLMTLKGMITGNPGNLHMIGNGHFGNLFQESRQLKLFVTFRGIAGVSSIEGTGGGVEIHFVESK